MAHLKFDVSKIAKLDDPRRFETMNPERMWQALGSPTPEVIVEIGAGTGLFSARFAEMSPGTTVFAVDTESSMLEWMSEHRSEVAAGRIVPVLSTESQVPLADECAHLVVMLNLHHELAEPAALYAEALRLLAPGGQVLVVDWAPIDTPKGPPLAVRASADKIVAVLEQVGFASVEEHQGALPWHWLVTGVRP